MPAKTFIDSDVIVSSLISQTGAAYYLLSKINSNYFYSDFQTNELNIVCDRLKLPTKKLKQILLNLTEINLKTDLKKYLEYVNDSNDAHIIAGAHQAKTKFLITYNLKDYQLEEIKADFDILILTPGQYLQRLRS